MCASDELKAGQVFYKKCLGENLAIFRGNDQKAYVLDAYCAHMGANLGLGGKVKNESCLECPFHGWMYDGNTGNCLGNEGKNAKKADVYEYHNIEKLTKKDDCYFQKTGTEEAKLRKWVVRETHHQIFIWYHPNENQRLEPLYELLDLKDYDHLEYRGYGINVIKNHISEVLENTADFQHFHYVHGQLIPNTDLLRLVWDFKWKPAEDPDFVESMRHEDKFQDEYRKSLIDRYINDKNRKYVSMNAVTLNIKWPINNFMHYGATGTNFILGSSSLYFFFRSWWLYDAYLSINVLPVDKYEQHFVISLFTNKSMPYWFSTMLICYEVNQIKGDGVIWDNKRNSLKTFYNPHGFYEKMLIKWRNFYARFYAYDLGKKLIR